MFFRGREAGGIAFSCYRTSEVRPAEPASKFRAVTDKEAALRAMEDKEAALRAMEGTSSSSSSSPPPSSSPVATHEEEPPQPPPSSSSSSSSNQLPLVELFKNVEDYETYCVLVKIAFRDRTGDQQATFKRLASALMSILTSNTPRSVL